jgi:hypothetical protein
MQSRQRWRCDGGGCEPYVNPAAFMRPPKGHLGNAPRTLSITEPMRHYFDLSIQKISDAVDQRRRQAEN